MQIKNVLFVGLNYHGYTDAIADEIRSEYKCHVDYIDIQPRSFFWNVLKVLWPKLFWLLLSNYHKYHFSKCSDISYERVFFLQAHQVSDNNFSLLRKLQSEAKFVLYNWDSLKNHDYLSKVRYFDRVFTFDPADAKAHKFDYLPLFCSRELQGFEQSASKEIFMIGNIVNPLRLDAVNTFQKFCTDKGLCFKTHLRVSLLVLLKLSLAKYGLKNLELRDASKTKTQSFYESSSVVFDWANHAQVGLTMRAAEALGTGKMLITNCAYLKNAGYASPGQVLVIDDRFDFSEVENFINSGSTAFQPNEELYIQNFVMALFKD